MTPGMAQTTADDSDAALASLRSFYPVRASQLMGYLRSQNALRNVLEDWRESQILKLTLSLNYNVDELITAFQEKRI